MKIAIISDIHGNSLALDAVLEDIKEKHCQMVLCLGDIAIGGYAPEYCIDKISQLASGALGAEAKVIAGDTDLMFLKYKKTLLLKTLGIPPLYKDFLKFDKTLISDESCDFLKSLPTKLEITVGNFSIYCCHGTPKSISEGINQRTSVPHLERIAKSVQSDIIVCAHSHVPCVFYLPSGKAVLNVGSVGYPKTDDKSATYAIIDVQNAQGDFVADICKVEYDIANAISKTKHRNFLGAILQAKILEGEE